MAWHSVAVRSVVYLLSVPTYRIGEVRFRWSIVLVSMIHDLQPLLKPKIIYNSRLFGLWTHPCHLPQTSSSETPCNAKTPPMLQSSRLLDLPVNPTQTPSMHHSQPTQPPSTPTPRHTLLHMPQILSAHRIPRLHILLHAKRIARRFRRGE